MKKLLIASLILAGLIPAAQAHPKVRVHVNFDIPPPVRVYERPIVVYPQPVYYPGYWSPPPPQYYTPPVARYHHGGWHAERYPYGREWR